MSQKNNSQPTSTSVFDDAFNRTRESTGVIRSATAKGAGSLVKLDSNGIARVKTKGYTFSANAKRR